MDIYAQMMATAVNAGLAVMPIDKAMKLMAACYAYGDETFVLSRKLHTDTMIAAAICNIEPCAIPPHEIMGKITSYYREIVIGDGIPAWLSELGAEYGVNFPPRHPYRQDWKSSEYLRNTEKGASHD